MQNNEEKLKLLIADGIELSQRGDFFEARRYFFEAKKIAPTCPIIRVANHHNNARRCRSEKKFSSALNIYNQILAISPNDFESLLRVGILLRDTDPKVALENLEKALAVCRNNSELITIWEVKGACYHNLKDMRSELKCYLESQKIESTGKVQFWIDGVKKRLGTFLIEQGNELSRSSRFLEARQYFNEARAIDPGCQKIEIAALHNDAMRSRHTGNFSEAIQSYRKVLTLSPEDVHALMGLGILLREDDPTTALQYLEKARSFQPPPSVALRCEALIKRIVSRKPVSDYDQDEQIRFAKRPKQDYSYDSSEEKNMRDEKPTINHC